ncbi:hypothetical protein ASPWEDRAFT_176845 [Aspergillus wentii DTO 134E9]|uniref:Uncharacterized protein n=1 Tax=Aspergillus wentii DTO 134E9 TaxID=1073089 RepID=A0A1L9R5I5_ASPWE|nr:uncharacterized protein ASPWEDRAFT_176845 [Aspergillus wentii DTO 134E9]KAI9925328.1 hypothetical protein MW887_006256 [Aspergillus wentii]OJJ30175.1 hypothetical protein ASPWEDRAFT_176845 [Aspergillus wentii DTO 134E9]
MFENTLAFPSLKTVSLNDQFEGVDTHSELATNMFYLPAVRRIEYHGLWEFTPYMIDAMEGTPSGKLTHFQVEIGEWHNNDKMGQEYLFQASPFRQLLLPSQDTLRALSLDFDREHRFRVHYCWNERSFHTESITDILPFGSTKEFHLLRNLKMRYANLAGLPCPQHVDEWDGHHQQSLVDILPSSLASLTITETPCAYLRIVISDVEALLKGNEKGMPRLKHIILQIWPKPKDFEDIKVLLDGLSLVAEGMGVRMGYELERYW